MKSRTSFCICLIFCLLTLTFAFSCKNSSDKVSSHNSKSAVIESFDKSELSIPRKKIDLGKVKSNATVQGIYSLHNSGETLLKIEYINPDCTCTGFSLSKKEIEPGDSAILILKMSTKNKEGDTKVHATISANTETRLYQVILTATVIL